MARVEAQTHTLDDQGGGLWSGGTSELSPEIITGTGFGTKAATTPYYEDFEGEALGAVSSPLNSLNISNATSSTIINSDQRSGTKSFQQDYAVTSFPKAYVTLSGASKSLYMSCAVKFTGTCDASASVWKFGRVGANTVYSGIGRAGASYTALSSATTPANFAGEIINSDGLTSWNAHNTASDGSPNSIITNGDWHFYELEFNSGTIDTSDAYFTERWSGKDSLIWNNRPFLTAANSSEIDWVLTPVNGLDGSHPITMLMDDLYIDESRCRVVMTDNAVYANSTKWAAQPVVTWSDTAIEITRKRQSFSVNDTAYYHVFNSSGSLVHSASGHIVGAD